MDQFEQDRQMETVKVNRYEESYLQDILRLEEECFPKDWQYENGKEYYRVMLENKENIHIFLKRNNAAVGYVLARPHNEIVDELKEDDSKIKKKDDCYYIETIQLSPKVRGLGVAKMLLVAVCEEANRRNIINFSIHARTTNCFAEKLKYIFDGQVTLVRKIERWKYACDEPYEYVEWNIKGG